jgi:phytoene dehydrogenase-like protein
VLVLEAADVAGGGTRTESLTLPGFLHDVCSAIHPMGASSPCFRALELEAKGLAWAHPDIAVAHPFDDGTAAVIHRDVEATASSLGVLDGDAYRRLFAPLVARADDLVEDAMRPLRLPRHPLLLARFGLAALRSAAGLTRSVFAGDRARAMFGAVAAHALLPLDAPGTAAFALMMMTAGHHAGWPAARGGSRAITDAMVAYLAERGGEVRTGHRVTSLAELPESHAVLLDLTPRQVLAVADGALPPGYRRRLERFRYGAGSFKVDWALDGPIPWRNHECRRAGTVHVVGGWDELATSERAVSEGRVPDRPLVLVTQQSLFDPTRAPAGKHTGWAYCHVPHGSDLDATDRIEAQIERFAPGFRERILRRHIRLGADWESYNPNYVGGDINAGVQDLWQLFTRPVMRLTPYRIPVKGLYLCSSSTPPGGGVHGMCGYHAAQTALKDLGA